MVKIISMNLFNTIFSKSEKSQLNDIWTEITSIDHLNTILEQSERQVVAIFKHSTRCSISRKVLAQFEKQISSKNIKCYYLDLLNYREISNEIAEQMNVVHQSPQLIILKNKEVVLHVSHNGILNVNLDNFL